MNFAQSPEKNRVTRLQHRHTKQSVRASFRIRFIAQIVSIVAFLPLLLLVRGYILHHSSSPMMILARTLAINLDFYLHGTSMSTSLISFAAYKNKFQFNLRTPIEGFRRIQRSFLEGPARDLKDQAKLFEKGTALSDLYQSLLDSNMCSIIDNFKDPGQILLNCESAASGIMNNSLISFSSLFAQFMENLATDLEHSGDSPQFIINQPKYSSYLAYLE